MVAGKDRQIAELQRQVTDLQAKVGGSVGSLGGTPAVPADTRAGACRLERRPVLRTSPAACFVVLFGDGQKLLAKKLPTSPVQQRRNVSGALPLPSGHPG